MTLPAVLRSLHALSDLPALVHTLGCEPLWQPAALPGAGESLSGVVIARAAGVPWLAVEASDPGPAARRLAMRAGGTGRPGVVLALDAARRELAISAYFGEGATLKVHLDEPGAATLASLRRLGAAAAAGSPSACMARTVEALAGRGVTREFFRRFRVVLDSMADALPGVPAAERRPLALLQLTRVLFLYFIQSKGWLDGRADFLAAQVDRCLATHRPLQRALLEPLCFGALNRRSAERSEVARRLGRLPFLNGGLFEPHALERRYRPRIPDPVWRRAFDDLFERYHFTAAETDPAGPSIAPDMLGRVFEGLMASDIRRASGTFYTPAVLVRRVVDAAVVALVASRSGCTDAAAEARLARGDPEACAPLRSARILDPAAGSGAFLLGLLKRLATIAAPEGARGSAPTRRRVLRDNLFGVDRDPVAVRLAELRLWLAVVAADGTEDPLAVAPLPNLDSAIRQGDSLREPRGLPAESPDVAARLLAARRRCFEATGPAKQREIAALRHAEARAAERQLGAAASGTEHTIRDLLAAARSPTLFGARAGLDAAGRQTLSTLHRRLRELRAARRAVERDQALPWFQFAAHFPEVMSAGGFDAVVGNPPWVRAESLPPAERSELRGRYRWWRASGPGFRHEPDLAVAFVERGLELLAPGGVLAFLAPAKLATAGYAEPLRSGRVAGTRMNAVHDLTEEYRGAFDATVYPMALVVTRARPDSAHRIRRSLDPSAPTPIAQSSLGGGPWIVAGDRVQRLAARLGAEWPLLGERYRCRPGVKTGADAVFLDPSGLEPEMVRPAIRGRDVEAFAVRSRHWLFWPMDEGGRPLDRLPPAAARHAAAHRATLLRRADYRQGPPWQVFRIAAALGRYRVVWPDLAPELRAAPLAENATTAIVPLNSCYVADTSCGAAAYAVAAWLNCRWIGGLAALHAAPAANGYRRFTAATVARLPLPPTVENSSELATIARAPGASTEALDDPCAELLGLDAGDRKVLAAVAPPRPHHRR